jgi:hypothetical protein
MPSTNNVSLLDSYTIQLSKNTSEAAQEPLLTNHSTTVMMLPPLPPPILRRAQLDINLTSLTDAELHAFTTSERHHSAPPYIYFLCALWLTMVLYIGIPNMLSPHRRLSHYLRLPDRWFRWAPGKAKFDLENKVKEEVREAEERRRARERAERTLNIGVPPAAASRREGRESVRFELRMMTPLERRFAR